MTEQAVRQRPLPFVREIRYQMDNCGATNKSQFALGGLGLSLLSATVDVYDVRFMVVGHTKFGPDDQARNIAGVFQRSDTFNLGMFMEQINTCSTGEMYDGTGVLREYKAASSGLFKKVDSIMSLRCFTLVADDGELDLGEAVSMPAGKANMPCRGPLYSEVTLRKELTKLKERSLRKVMLNVIDKKYKGVGSGSGLFGEAPAQLLPSELEKVRIPRLFCKCKDTDEVVCEQVGWFAYGDAPHGDPSVVEAVNKALELATIYRENPGNEKAPYGQHLNQLHEMYRKYVPVQFVPNQFPLGVARSSTLRQAVLGRGEDGRAHATRVVPTTSTSLKRQLRYSQSRDDPALIDILGKPPYCGRAKRLRGPDWKNLAEQMPCTEGYSLKPESIKNAAKRLIYEQRL